MIRHVVLLRFREPQDATELERTLDDTVDALRALPERIPSIRAYRVERDLGLAHDNAHLVVIADFDDAEGHAAYRDDPHHLEVLERLIRPSLEWRSAVQISL
jgi:quinol monooxygenase YgiN